MKQIVIERREHDVKAYIKGATEHWGCGKTTKEAIGDLVTACPEQLGIAIDYQKPIAIIQAEAFIAALSDVQLNRIYEVDTEPCSLNAILQGNLIEEPQMDLSDAESIIALEVGESTVVGMVDVKRIS